MRTLTLVSLSLLAFALACPAPPPLQEPPPPPDGDGDDDDDDELVIDDARVAALVAEFDTVAQCPERAWLTHSWDDNRIVLKSSSDGRAWVWHGKDVAPGGPRESALTEEVAMDSLPAEWQLFEFFNVNLLDGAVALGIDLDATAGPPIYTDFASHLAFHEGFHFLGGQDDFTSGDTGGRDPSLPLQWEPRFYRDRMIDALARGSLEDAKHWHQKHVTEFADDAAGLEGLDVIEGTAQHVETVSVIVARLGCDAGDADIVAEFNANPGSFVFDVGFDAGGESYVIGPLAGIALRDSQGQAWEQEAKGAPMHGLALRDVAAAAVDESAHEARRAETEDAIEGINSDVSAAVAPFLTEWDDVAGNVRLALPYEALIGSFGYGGGFILSERADDLHVLLGVEGTLAPAGGGDGAFTGAIVVEDFAACGTDMFVVAVDAAAASRDGDVVSLERADMSAVGVAVDEVVVDGATWWCVR